MDKQVMDELGARNVMLVQAIETNDLDGRILSDDDRHYASRTANELAQWDVASHSGNEANLKDSARHADGRAHLLPELFLQKRAEQILKKIVERTPSFARLMQMTGWMRVLTLALPALALLAGVGVDHIGDPHRVDLLSVPLLLIIGWNLVVYVAMLVWGLLPASRRAGTQRSGLARMMTAKAPSVRKMPPPLVAAMTSFNREWLRIGAPLTNLRVKRTIHLSAACLAAGAVISLYARGIVSQYRAGWESTFLNAEQVHAVLSAVFLPVTALLGLPGFSVDEIRALEFARSSTVASGARWVHLYGGTILLLVILPRLLLAFMSGFKERRLARHFPLDLNQPYFRKLTKGIGPSTPAVLRVYPYSFTIDEQRDHNLTIVAQLLLGEQARVMLRPSMHYGEETQDVAVAADTNGDLAMTVALFNLSATPERESHGAFLDQLRGRYASSCTALVDESAYRERVGTQAGGDARLRERIELWRQFCDMHKMPVTIVNLLDPQVRAADLERGPDADSASMHSKQ